MRYSTDDEMFTNFLEKTTRIELAIALASIGITTVVKLLGQRGMNQDPISDPGTVALLDKLRAKDPGLITTWMEKTRMASARCSCCAGMRRLYQPQWRQQRRRQRQAALKRRLGTPLWQWHSMLAWSRLKAYE